MSEKRRYKMVLVVVNMKKPFSILFPKDASNDQIMECLGDAILNKKADEYFTIEKFPIDEELHLK